MLPTLMGRIQTRIFATLFIGGIWNLVVPFFLPHVEGAPYGDVYKILYSVLVQVVILGIGWEVIYHGLMQFRWEKDWPTLFGLVTIVNEGIVAYLCCHNGWFGDSGFLGKAYGVPKSTFATAFVTTWIVLWLFFNGPMRIFTVHWRFRGGRLV